MDDDNYHTLMRVCPDEHKSKVQYFLDYATQYPEREVPDPYYGGRHGFERVLDMIEAASEGFLSELKHTKQLG
jgi:protein-tyrosine phosphatase